MLNKVVNSNSQDLYFPPILVEKGEVVDKFISELCNYLQLTPKYISDDNLDIESLKSTLIGRDLSSLLIFDENSIHPHSIDLLRKARSINIMKEGENANSNSHKRKQASLYDIWLPLPGKISDMNLNTQSSLRSIISLFNRLSSIPSKEDTLIDAGIWSHFVSLTFPSIDRAVSSLPSLRIGADAFELRVDLLEDNSPSSLHRQIALLKSVCNLPVVFTVRSKGQIGKYPDNDPEGMFNLLNEGLRAGCEWIDIEACWDEKLTQTFIDKLNNEYRCTSRILGSLHKTIPQSRPEVTALFEATRLNNCAHILKVVTGADGNADCELVHTVGQEAIHRKSDTESNSDSNSNSDSDANVYIGLCLGEKGSRSRVLNRRFTPVTHPMMATAAPGQLTAKQLMDERIREGLLSPKQFYLFGYPIGKSLSPAMHNAAYQTLILPHTYSLKEDENVDAYKSILSQEEFGGASVTIPHKENIIPFLDEVRGAANEIGAVNTIVPEWFGGKRKLVGYNTDWLGILRPITKKLKVRGISWVTSTSGGEKSKSYGVVIGAGGTSRAACYAVKQLGLELIVVNRNHEKGTEIANKFGGIFLPELSYESVRNLGKIHVLISTIPNSAGYTAPVELLREHRPVVLDVVYSPAKTKLLEQAMEAKCYYVQGATMLLEQAIEQFQLWNNRRAPRDVMEQALFNGIEKLDDNYF